MHFIDFNRLSSGYPPSVVSTCTNPNPHLDIMSRVGTDVQNEERPQKRPSRSNPDDGNESPYLPESILEEIMVRLPLDSIFRFKCVSKSWLSRLSEPSFAQKYQSFKNFTPSWTLLYGLNQPEEEAMEGFYTLSSNGLFSRTIGYIYFPPRAIRILASTDGLLLCGDPYEGCYYLCNPFNVRQMLSVPRPSTWVNYQVEGLITQMDELGVVVKSYKVIQVRMLDYAKPCSFDVFCSDSGNWTTYHAYAPPPHDDPKYVGGPRDRIFSAPISFKETLYIPDYVEGVIMVYNPYADPCKLHLIHLPDRGSGRRVLWGTCRGRLRFYYWINISNRGPVHKVWELVDDREGKWLLVHSTLTGSNNYVRSSQSLLSMEEYWPVSFDPIDRDLMYFDRAGCIYSYHMATGKLELLCQRNRYSRAGLQWTSAVPYELRTWPTLFHPPTWPTCKT